MPSTGFIVITLMAIPLILAPGAVLFLREWKARGFRRVGSLVLLALASWLSWGIATDPSTSDFEEKAVMIFSIWGIVLYLGLVSFLVVHFIRLGIRHLENRAAMPPS